MRVGIVGASGAVGIEMIRCLEETDFPLTDLNLYANRTAGEVIKTVFGDKTILSAKEPNGIGVENDIILMATSGAHSKEISPHLQKEGAVVIDNSSAFRLTEDVPLIIPEINGELLTPENRLIANPNCTTAILLMALAPIAKKLGLKKVSVTTFQAVSGAGKEGLEELIQQEKDSANGISFEESPMNIFAHPIHGNLIPKIDNMHSSGFTGEEMKVVEESAKILGPLAQGASISCTAVRVPVQRAHSEDVLIETKRPITSDDLNEIRLLLGQSPGLRLVDDPEKEVYPMPLMASSKFDVFVGRLRIDPIFDQNGEHYGLRMFVSGGSTSKGGRL